MHVTFVINRNDNSLVDAVPVHESTSAVDMMDVGSDFDVGHRSMDVRESVER